MVAKSNHLNELRPRDMGLQELRFLTLYLSKINPKDKKSRVVRFPIEEFQRIMELGRVDIKKLKAVCDSLLRKTTSIDLPSGGFVGFSIFHECKVDNKGDGWYIEINAHDRALPLMFDLKSHYFKYELWNALRLKSLNQLRMYEVLKQYQHVGERIISITDLKTLIGIDENDYPRFNSFRERVLDPCKKALQDWTDIIYTYAPHGKRGRGGKILALKFTIERNKNHVDPLSIEKFIDLSKQVDPDDYDRSNPQEIDFNKIDENGNVRATGRNWKYEERITFLLGACNNEFSREEIAFLFDKIPNSLKYDELGSHDYLQSKYREMEMRRPKTSRFGYLRKIIEEDYSYGAKNVRR